MGRRNMVSQSKEKILELCKEYNNNLSAVAYELKTSRPSLYKWMRSDGLGYFIDNVQVKTKGQDWYGQPLKSKPKKQKEWKDFIFDPSYQNPDGTKFREKPKLIKKKVKLTNATNNATNNVRKKQTSRKIKSANQFFEYLKKHPNHLHSKFFLDRLHNPRRPDISTIEKVFSVLNEAEA